MHTPQPRATSPPTNTPTSNPCEPTGGESIGWVAFGSHRARPLMGGRATPPPRGGLGRCSRLRPAPYGGPGYPALVGGWGGGRLISRAEPLAFLSPRRPRQRRRGRGAAAAAACTQAGRFRIALHKFACFKACALQGGAGSLRRRGPTRRAFARCVRCRRTGFFSAVGRACVARHGAAPTVGLAAPWRLRWQPRRL